MAKNHKLVIFLEKRKNLVLASIFGVMILAVLLVIYFSFSSSLITGVGDVQPQQPSDGRKLWDDYIEESEGMEEEFENFSENLDGIGEQWEANGYLWSQFTKECQEWSVFYDCEGEIPDDLLSAAAAYINTTNETVIRQKCYCSPV